MGYDGQWWISYNGNYKTMGKDRQWEMVYNDAYQNTYNVNDRQ